MGEDDIRLPDFQDIHSPIIGMKGIFRRPKHMKALGFFTILAKNLKIRFPMKGCPPIGQDHVRLISVQFLPTLVKLSLVWDPKSALRSLETEREPYRHNWGYFQDSTISFASALYKNRSLYSLNTDRPGRRSSIIPSIPTWRETASCGSKCCRTLCFPSASGGFHFPSGIGDMADLGLQSLLLPGLLDLFCQLFRTDQPGHLVKHLKFMVEGRAAA